MAEGNNDPRIYVGAFDNVVLSDMLFFITNRLNTHPVENIIEICDKFYDEKTVVQEKTKFFNALVKKFSLRRTHDKKIKDLEDIIHEMQLRDRTNAYLPTFAAVNLHHLPTTDDGTITNSQLLSKDIKGERRHEGRIYCANWSFA